MNLEATGDDWQNSQITLTGGTYAVNLLDGTTKRVTFDMWSSTATCGLLKFESGLNGAGNKELPFNVSGTGWETITVDFSGGGHDGSAVNGEYNKFVLFFNYCDAAGNPTGTAPDVRYIDNINYLQGTYNEPPFNPGSAPTPTAAAEDVISIYSDTYTTGVTSFNVNPGWGQQTALSQVTLADGDQALFMENLNYQGHTFDAVDLSTMSHVHFDYYNNGVPFGDLRFSLINTSAPGGTVEQYVSTDASTVDAWVSVDIALSDYTNMTGLLGAIDQLKWGDAAGGSIYIDNLYFYAAANVVDPITSFPYCSSFDADLEGWSTEVAQGTSDWSSSASTGNGIAAYSVAGAFYSASNYNGDNSTLVSPAMDITSMTDPTLTFQLVNPDWAGDQDTLAVWFKAAAGDAWSVLATYSAVTTAFEEVSLSLPNASSDYYVAFNATSGYGYGIMIDDVCIDEAPACLPPTDLLADGVSDISASIYWTSDAPSFEFQHVVSGEAPAETGTVTENSATTLAGVLTANTSYDFYIRSLCADGSISEWVSLTFTTQMGLVASFPYCSSFDADLEGWSTEVAQGTSDWSSSASTGNGIAAYSVAGAFYSASNYNGDNSTLVSPAMDITSMTDPTLTFQLVNPDWAGDQDTLAVWFKAAAGDAWSVLATYSAVTTAFEEVSLSLPNASSDYYVAFNATSGYGYGIMIDDVCIDEAPACPSPEITEVVSSDISASIYWTSVADNYEFQYVLSGEAPAETGTVTENSATTLTNLTPAASYDFYVRSLCADGSISEWTSVTFTMDPACGSTVTYTQVSSGNYTAGVTSSVASYLASVTINGDLEQSSFSGTCYDNLYVTDGAGNALNPDQTCGIFTDVTFTSSDNTINVQIVNDGSVENGDITLLFTCSPPPDCPAPEITEVVSSDMSASIYWTSVADNYEFQYVLSGEAPAETGTVTANSATTLAGVLTANTSYDFYVRSLCADGSISTWTSATFTTDYSPIVPDYLNDFTTYPGEFWTESEGPFGAPLPTDSTSLWADGGFGNQSGTGAARVNIFTAFTDEYLISPIFDLSAATYYLNVDAAATQWGQQTDAVWGDDDYVALVVSSNAGGSWTELYRWDANNNPAAAGTAMPEIELTGYQNDTMFAFYAFSDFAASTDIDFFIDNFSISATSTPLGVDDNLSLRLFSYFPNPVNDQLTIKAQKNVDSITVFNMLGQVVLRQTPNGLETMVDMADMQTGAYFVQVSIANSIETIRILKK